MSLRVLQQYLASILDNHGQYINFFNIYIVVLCMPSVAYHHNNSSRISASDSDRVLVNSAAATPSITL